MITGLTEEQFRHLPGSALLYPCDRCGNQHSYSCHIKRSLNDYALVDGEITTKNTYTALYLCSACEWQMVCDYRLMEREQERQIKQMMSNEARWLQKISHLSVQELANRVGVSRQAYHKWLRGKTITEEHKARIKEIVATYMREHEEDDAYFAVGFTFAETST